MHQFRHQSLRILSFQAHTEINLSIRLCLFLMVFFSFLTSRYSEAIKVFEFHAQQKLGNLPSFRPWSTIAHMSSPVPEKPLLLALAYAFS